MAKLNDLVSNVTTWSELESKIAALPQKERGYVFEQFCKAFFKLDPIYRFKEVYLWGEVPPSIRERLGHPEIQDLGIDGVCVTEDDTLTAYQCKFRSNRKKTLPISTLSNFMMMSDHAEWRIVISNIDTLRETIARRVNQSRVLADSLDILEPEFFDRLREYLESPECNAPRPTKRKPREHQLKCIQDAVEHYKTHDRGQMIMPCGTGKSLAAMWIAESLGAARILVMVPSLALMSQTLREWAINTSIAPFRYLCLCSDPTVGIKENDDSPIENIHELGIPVTTDATTVAAALSSHEKIVLFSTYQSSDALKDAVGKSEIVFDLGIFDEAHRTTGKKVGSWNKAVDDKNAPIKKRLFMTATPRLYAPHVVEKAKAQDDMLYSMDDETVYGRPFYDLSFGEAIDQRLISDYKVIISFVTEAEAMDLLQNGGVVNTGDGSQWDANAFAKRVVLIKGMKAFGLKKMFTFHGKVKGAAAFTDEKSPYGFKKVVELLAPTDGRTVGTYHVSGKMSAKVRRDILKEFKKAETGVVSNARCLTEGVDVPAVDTVAFIDPKESLVDIVQATGRAMRTNGDKKDKGYIFIPVVIDQQSDIETAFQNSAFATVWRVVQALKDQDQRLRAIISNLRVMQGKGEKDTAAWKDAMSQFTAKVEFINLPERMDVVRFTNALQAKALDVVGESFDFGFGELLAFKEDYKHLNVPKGYRSPSGFNLYIWGHSRRQDYKKGLLALDRIARLEAIGFVWNPYDAAFEKGFKELLTFKKENGHLNVPYGYKTPLRLNLYSWASARRVERKNGILAPDRIARLETIGFVWDMFDAAFEKGLKELLVFMKKNGHIIVPKRYKTQEGFKLGGWITEQRKDYKKGLLALDRIARLETIGFVWNTSDASFEEGFKELLIFKKENGHLNVPQRYKSPSGFNLYSWGHRRRQDYKKGLLALDRVARLETIGFVWNTSDASFEEGFKELLIFRKENGHLNVPQRYKSQTGFKLGNWVWDRRKAYKKGLLTSDRVTRLEKIVFVWDILNALFEKGFAELLAFKEEHGHVNVSSTYKTLVGFGLGSWVRARRQDYKAGSLAPNRISRLEEIGFVWDMFRIVKI